MFSRSPNFARKGHQQITQDGVDEEDRIIAGAEFGVQYMGSVEVAGGCGTGSGKTDVPVEKVMAQNKTKNKSKRMTMVVTNKSLSMKEDGTRKLVASFPISKVTYCNVDSTYEKAFAFVARERKEKPFKAYVLLCDTKARAQEVFKAISLAFKMNYESIQASAIREANLRSHARSPNDIEDGNDAGFRAESNNNTINFQYGGETDWPCTPENCQNSEEVLYLSPSSPKQPVRAINKRLENVQDNRTRSNTAPSANSGSPLSQNVPVKLEDDFDEFTELAKSRTSTVDSGNLPNLPSTNTQRWGSDPMLFNRLTIH